jgi:hypothetical protein
MEKLTQVYCYKRLIEIIDWLEWMGFPNKKNIETLENLVLMIKDLVPQVNKPVFTASAKELSSTVQKIKTRLKTEGEIPSRLYERLNAELIVFKENLITDMASWSVDKKTPKSKVTAKNAVTRNQTKP